MNKINSEKFIIDDVLDIVYEKALNEGRLSRDEIRRIERIFEKEETRGRGKHK